MFNLPLSPYYKNLYDYWDRDFYHSDNCNFWDWVKKEQRADVARDMRPAQWKFKNEQDMLWFILRWS
jgi:hypothetical protein